MTKILFSAKDYHNPIESGYEKCQNYIINNLNNIDNYYITSHCIGTRMNKYQEVESTYVYNVCVDI